MLDAMHPLVPLLRADFPFGNGGIGDGLETPDWVLPGYENPPSEHVWDTTSGALGTALPDTVGLKRSVL